MNTTSAQVTSEHRIKLKVVRREEDEAWALSHEEAAQLIADSEALALIELAMVAAGSADRNVSLRLERDQLRAVFPQICAALGNGAFCTPTVSVGFIESIPNEVELVIAELRARAERAEADAAAYLKRAESFRKIGDEAEAELATERARMDWLESDNGVDWQSQLLIVSRDAIDKAMQEEAK